jgi:hypothetical protein
MKRVSYANKTVFVDDATADALVEYAGLVAAEQTGDTITVRALGQDGNEVDASFVLNMSTSLIVESTNSSVEAPSNPVALAYMQKRIQLIRHPPNARLVDDVDVDGSSVGRGPAAGE